ncbi:DUF427 domain-containing protein [Sunxiuqinia indica]|uniref:DUF427 domain-containing protein n=1 Tax=Sunxiuqinia indica TaxID=2692584 RepID=UPI0013585411|nr:DUF427 domain-containing protein [Sunxiuqinia indica]
MNLKRKAIAESQDIVNVEGNRHFPLESLNKEYLKDSDTQTACYWNGTTSYDDRVIDGKENHDAEPFGIANSIKRCVALWKGVQVISD